MKEFFDLQLFGENYGDVIVTSVFWIIFAAVLFTKPLAKARFYRETYYDLAKSNRENMRKIASMELYETDLRAKCRQLERELHIKQDFISRKGEYRLPNGRFCTEAQYFAWMNRDNAMPVEVEDKDEVLINSVL